MNFLSLPYLLLLVVTLSAFFLTPAAYRRHILWAASYVFYAFWNPAFLGLILFSTSVDYFLSHLIVQTTSPTRKKLYLIGGITMNLAILILFKYALFLTTTINGLTHYFGQGTVLPESLNFILPLGISFYTFEAISYLVDIYRGEKPAKSWADYNFFIMYFPHLISGPIIRFKNLITQYTPVIEKPNRERILKGVELLLFGVCFKALIADSAAGIADGLFSAPLGQTVLKTYAGVLAFTVQIYFDFMGYTHIARGTSLLFNLQLPLNFNHPYHATGIRDFWQRWHISLSTWLRDYLYIPLGGNRHGLARTLSNVLITMLIGGFWHGAGWTYLLWGGYHGLLLTISHLWETLFPGGAAIFSKLRWLSRPGIFILIALGWVLFRAPDLSIAHTIYAQLFDLSHLAFELRQLTPSEWHDLWEIGALLLACFLGPSLVTGYQWLQTRLPLWGLAYGWAILAMLCWIATANTQVPFIYFQF